MSFNRSLSRRKYNVLFFLLMIFVAGLSYIFRGRNSESSPSLPFSRNTHGDLLKEMAVLEDAPQPLENIIFSKIEIDPALLEVISEEESSHLKEKVYQVLIENTNHTSTREKTERVFKSEGFKFVIQDVPEAYGAGGKYEEETHRIIVVYDTLKKGIQLHGTVNHELHHADCHLARGDGADNNNPFITEKEREAFKAAVEACDSAITEELRELVQSNENKLASKEDRRLYVKVKKELEGYKPTMLAMRVPGDKAAAAQAELDLKNGKPVMIGKMHVERIEYLDGQAIGWGRHASNLTNSGQLVSAYVYDHLFHKNSVRRMYAEHASTTGQDLEDVVLVERDAEIHAAPKQAEFFCHQLTHYHRQFRKAHSVGEGQQTENAASSIRQAPGN